MCTYEAMGIDRILLGTDFPYEDAAECMQFLKQLPISPEEMEKVYYRNAAQLGIA
jgi:predicted TIM-barrel fold metal-dependent hydrolase